MDDLKKMIREVPDFPKKGILFYDITTLLKDKAGFRKVIDALTEQIRPLQPDTVLGIEARVFIFAPALAYYLCAGFVIYLESLKGRDRLAGYNVVSLLKY